MKAINQFFSYAYNYYVEAHKPLDLDISTSDSENLEHEISQFRSMSYLSSMMNNE